MEPQQQLGGYGEKKFTYDYNELLAQKEEDKKQREYNKERRELMEIIDSMSNEELEKLLEK